VNESHAGQFLLTIHASNPYLWIGIDL